MTGVILDVDTKEPLEYVTVFCKEEGIGTISNRNGSFTLLLENAAHPVTFSLVGYNSNTMTLSSNNEVLLQKAIIELDEVAVMPIENVQKLLSDVVKQYKRNHHITKTLCDIHLKQFDMADGKLHKVTDMLGELEMPEAKYLKKTNRFRLSAVVADLYQDSTVGSFDFDPKTIFTVFSIPYQIAGFLKKAGKNCVFYTSRLSQDNMTVCKVDFSPKESYQGKNRFSGSLFIDESTKALLEFRVYQNKSHIKGSFIKYNGNNLLFKPQETEIRVSYLKMNNREYLMTYAIVYDRFSFGDEQRSINLVLSTTNFRKKIFTSQHPIQLSSDLHRQLDEMNLPKTVHDEYNKVAPTREEQEFFNKNN
jgi:hypothetical protein